MLLLATPLACALGTIRSAYSEISRTIDNYRSVRMEVSSDPDQRSQVHQRNPTEETFPFHSMRTSDTARTHHDIRNADDRNG